MDGCELANSLPFACRKTPLWISPSFSRCGRTFEVLVPPATQESDFPHRSEPHRRRGFTQPDTLAYARTSHEKKSCEPCPQQLCLRGTSAPVRLRRVEIPQKSGPEKGPTIHHSKGFERHLPHRAREKQDLSASRTTPIRPLNRRPPAVGGASPSGAMAMGAWKSGHLRVLCLSLHVARAAKTYGDSWSNRNSRRIPRSRRIPARYGVSRLNLCRMRCRVFALHFDLHLSLTTRG